MALLHVMVRHAQKVASPRETRKRPSNDLSPCRCIERDQGSAVGALASSSAFLMPVRRDWTRFLGATGGVDLQTIRLHDQVGVCKRSIGLTYRRLRLDKRATGWNCCAAWGFRFAFTEKPDRRALALPPRHPCGRPRALC